MGLMQSLLFSDAHRDLKVYVENNVFSNHFDLVFVREFLPQGVQYRNKYLEGMRLKRVKLKEILLKNILLKLQWGSMHCNKQLPYFKQKVKIKQLLQAGFGHIKDLLRVTGEYLAKFSIELIFNTLVSFTVGGTRQIKENIKTGMSHYRDELAILVTVSVLIGARSLWCFQRAGKGFITAKDVSCNNMKLQILVRSQLESIIQMLNKTSTNQQNYASVGSLSKRFLCLVYKSCELCII